MMYIVVFDGTTADVVNEDSLESYLQANELDSSAIETRNSDEDTALQIAEDITFEAQHKS